VESDLTGVIAKASLRKPEAVKAGESFETVQAIRRSQKR
jgi:hypothetical protein